MRRWRSEPRTIGRASRRKAADPTDDPGVRPPTSRGQAIKRYTPIDESRWPVFTGMSAGRHSACYGRTWAFAVHRAQSKRPPNHFAVNHLENVVNDTEQTLFPSRTAPHDPKPDPR